MSKSGHLLPSLEDAWDEFVDAYEERRSKLTVAHLFYKNAEQVKQVRKIPKAVLQLLISSV